MEAVQILTTVNAQEDLPGDWLVFPLLSKKVMTGILGWVFGVVVGGFLFAIMTPIMIPHNYQAGVVSAIFTTLILGIVLFVALGSLWELIKDVQRLLHAEKYVIIITPEDFVKQEGEKIVHVPLEYVKYVTARGAAPVDRSLASARADARPPTPGESISSIFVGRRVAETGSRGLRRRMRTPTTLAFVDSRTDREITVANDKAHGDTFTIAALLKQYAEARVKNFV